MFEIKTPEHAFKSFDQFFETMGEYKYLHQLVEASEIRLHEDRIEVKGESYTLGDVFGNQLLRSLGLHVSNIKVLPSNRLVEDVNTLLSTTHENSFFAFRSVNGIAYDMIRLKKPENLLIPTGHKLFIRQILDSAPDLKDHEIHTFSLKKGVLNLRTINSTHHLEPLPDDISWCGLEIGNSDFNSYKMNAGLHVYRTSCTNSASSIYDLRVKPTTESTGFPKLVERIETFSTLAPYLGEAYKSLAETQLSEYMLKNSHHSLARHVGQKRSNLIFEKYMRLDPIKEEMVYEVPEETEYDLLNHITDTCKQFDHTNRTQAEYMAGSMLTNRLELIVARNT